MTDKTAFDSQVGGSHYKHFEIQPIVFCQVNKLGHMESSAIGYITRHPFKNGREDIEKAIHCLQMLLELEYPTETELPAPIEQAPQQHTSILDGGFYQQHSPSDNR